MKKIVKIFILIMLAFPCVFLFSGCHEKYEIEEKYKIEFIVDNSIYAIINSNGNEIIEVPCDPMKEGYGFEGWYFDRGTWLNKFDENDYENSKIEKDILVYAKWGTNVSSNDTIESKSVSFGKIDIDVSTAISVTADTTVMPGDTITVAGVVKNKEEKAYVGIKITVTGLSTDDCVAVDTVVTLDKDGTQDLASLVGTFGVITLTGANYGNTSTGRSVSVTIDIAAIQFKNINTAPTSYTNLVAIIG